MGKGSTSSRPVLAAAVRSLIALLLIPIANNAAQAEPSSDNAPNSIVLGDRGGLTPEPPVVPTQEGTTPSIEVGARAGFASDYIYRGVTLSDHKPAVGAGIEAALGLLYAGTTFTSVKLPNDMRLNSQQLPVSVQNCGISTGISGGPTLPIPVGHLLVPA
jgi:hypothetical protein